MGVRLQPPRWLQPARRLNAESIAGFETRAAALALHPPVPQTGFDAGKLRGSDGSGSHETSPWRSFTGVLVLDVVAMADLKRLPVLRTETF